MADGEGNTTYIEGFSGPNLEYAWIAEVSREPTDRGLDGGRIQYLSVVTRCPYFGDNKQVARFGNGSLTCDPGDFYATSVVAEVRENFTDKNMGLWQDSFPQQERPAPKISRSNRSRGRDADDGRER